MRNLQTLLFQSREESREAQVLMIEVAGEQPGDAGLRRMSELVRKFLGPADLVWSSGGGEELILALQTGVLDALDIIERIRAALRPNGSSVTPSFGVASSRECLHVPAALLERAAEALRVAKAKAHDRVCFLEGDVSPLAA